LILHNNATNPRDKIFGIYRLLENAHIKLPPVDYSSTVQFIFEEFARRIIEATEALWIFSFVNDKVEDPSMPSWVPQWGHAEQGFVDPLFEYVIHAKSGSFVYLLSEKSTTRGSSVDASTLASSPHGQIVLKGKVLSTIAACSSRWPVVDNKIHAVKTDMTELSHQCLLQWIGFCLAGLEPAEATKRWTALCEIMQFGLSEADSKFAEASSEAVVKLIVDAMNSSNDESLQGITRVLNKTLWNSVWRRAGCVLFQTASGLMGISAGAVQEADVVVLLAGSALLAILRSERDKFCLVGTAVVQDVMFGQQWPADTSLQSLPSFCLI
jgi:hypothetical protein